MGTFYQTDEPFSVFSTVARDIADKHKLLKQTNSYSGNNALFMNNKIRRSIMNRSRIKNRYLKWPSRENFLDLQRVNNPCKSLTKKTNKSYLNSVSPKDMTTNK